MRRALRQVLDAEVERRMADAYVQQPDNPERDVIDPETWEPRKARPGAAGDTVETARAESEATAPGACE